MLVPYTSLLQLPAATFDNLIKEFLLTQVEDGSFAGTDEYGMTTAIAQCKQALKQGELVVEFSEEDSSIAIRKKGDIVIDQSDESGI